MKGVRKFWGLGVRVQGNGALGPVLGCRLSVQRRQKIWARCEYPKYTLITEQFHMDPYTANKPCYEDFQKEEPDFWKPPNVYRNKGREVRRCMSDW